MIFEEAIIKSLKICLPDWTFVLADRNGVEPKAPYCLVSIIDSTNIGKPYLTTATKDDREVEIIQQNKEIDISLTLHALATDPKQNEFDRFHVGLGSSFVTSAFYQNNLSIMRYNDIVYVSTPVDTINYKRAVMDITLFCERIEEFHAPFIKVVDTEGTLIDSDKKVESEIDFNI